MNAEHPFPARIIAYAGHLAIWLGLYFVAAYIAATMAFGREHSLFASIACMCAGVGLYLLDRVKVGDAWLDTADQHAQPARFDFLLAHRDLVRVVAWIVLALGTLAAAVLDTHNLALPPIGIMGVIMYSSLRSTGNRLKDVLVVKNLLPGLAIAGLAVIFAWQSPPASTMRKSATGTDAWPVLGVLVGLVVLVTADTMLCDLDDIETDVAHGTSTVPTAFGRKATWMLALVLHALAGGLLAASGAAVGAVAHAVWIGGGNLAATLVLFRIHPTTLRDLVDLKLPVVVGLVWMWAQIA